MYINQILIVQWCQTLTNSFKVCNGVIHGGVLSPMLFAVHGDSLFGRLEQSGVGYWCSSVCWWRYTGCAKSCLCTLINICEQFALDYDITFNGNKSQFMFLKGRCSNASAFGINVNRQYVEVYKCAIHVGHSISSGNI